MGTTDRIIRIVIAVIFGALYFTNIITGVLGIVLLVLGVVFVATSFMKFCPIYLPFGIRTNKSEKKN